MDKAIIEKKVMDLVKEASADHSREGFFVASLLCHLNAAIVDGDLPDLAKWVGFYAEKKLQQNEDLRSPLRSDSKGGQP